MSGTRPRVVIIGAGFAGLNAAKELRKAPVSVTVIDSANHHLFQPLLYQVATGSLAPAQIAIPVRRALRDLRNTDVLLAEVESIDLERRTVRAGSFTVPYDHLVLACGVTTSYFGKDDLRRNTIGLKTLPDALAMRRRILLAYEEAEYETDEAARRRKLTFVIVGGGATGVELAGALIETSRLTLPHDFRHVDTRVTRVVLVEGDDRLLPALPEKLGRSAQRELEDQGVEIRLGTMVTGVDGTGVDLGEERIEAETVLWAAGVRAPEWLADLGVPTDRAGRIEVGPDLAVPGHPEVLVAGDAARVEDPDTDEPVPGVAPAAIQMGRYAGRTIRGDLEDRPREPFRYRDKGSMAVISRGRAVAAVGRLRLGGFPAWVVWAVVHILYLIGFRRRMFVFLEWVWSFLFHVRGNRLIVEPARLQVSRREDDGED